MIYSVTPIKYGGLAENRTMVDEGTNNADGPPEVMFQGSLGTCYKEQNSRDNITGKAREPSELSKQWNIIA